MPQSSGGGSHSGGYSSHSSSGSSRSYSSGGSHSSGYSSHSSGSSYSRSSGSSYSRSYGSSSRGYSSSSSYSSRPGKRKPPKPPRPSPSVSSKMFNGAERYVYYRDHKPRYVYSDYRTLKKDRRWGRFTFWAILVGLMILGYSEILTPPQKLVTNYDTSIVIEDNLGIIDDQDALRRTLKEFLDQTGITPAIVTETNDSWQLHYTTLTNQAFDLYVNTFPDEKHWLIVYSQPEEPDPSFNDWYWEEIHGDDTVDILTKTSIDNFGQRLQKYLTASSRYTVGEALSMAFEEFTPVLMASGTQEDYLAAALIILITALIGLLRSKVIRFHFRRPSEVPRDAVRVEPKAAEITCGYCGGVYLDGVIRCPHCGAARSAAK